MTTHAQIGFAPSAVTTDLAEFEQACDEGERVDAPERRAALLERAVSLYAGDFQPGNYQDWAVQESERLQARLSAALERLQEAWETLGCYPKAVQAARRHLALDPFSEKAHLALIRSLVHSGQLAAAQEAADSLEQFFSPRVRKRAIAGHAPDDRSFARHSIAGSSTHGAFGFVSAEIEKRSRSPKKRRRKRRCRPPILLPRRRSPAGSTAFLGEKWN